MAEGKDQLGALPPPAAGVLGVAHQNPPLLPPAAGGQEMAWLI